MQDELQEGCAERGQGDGVPRASLPGFVGEQAGRSPEVRARELPGSRSLAGVPQLQPAPASQRSSGKRPKLQPNLLNQFHARSALTVTGTTYPTQKTPVPIGTNPG